MLRAGAFHGRPLEDLSPGRLGLVATFRVSGSHCVGPEPIVILPFMAHVVFCQWNIL